MARVQIGRIRNSCRNLVAIGLLPGNSIFFVSPHSHAIPNQYRCCFVVPPCTVHTSSHHKYPLFPSPRDKREKFVPYCLDSGGRLIQASQIRLAVQQE